MKRLIFILATVALVASVSQAAVMVDFGERNSPSVPEGDGRIYNDRPRAYGAKDPNIWGPGVVWDINIGDYVPIPGPLVDEDGNSVGTIEVYTIGMDGWLGKTITAYGQPNGSGYPDNVTDGVGNKTPSASPMGVKWVNVPAGTYDVKLVTHYAGEAGNTAALTCQGTTINVGGACVTSTWTNVSPVAGEIQIDAVVSGSMFFAVTELVPEPATMTLLALGGLMAIRRRR